jgi:general stress protein 26
MHLSASLPAGRQPDAPCHSVTLDAFSPIWENDMEQLDAAARARILDILQQGHDMTLATIRPDGYPQATTVSYVHDGLTIYAAVGLGSQKADNIQHNHRVSGTVNLPYSRWHDIHGISFAGSAAFVQDAEQINDIAQKILQKFPEARQFAPAGNPMPWQGLLFLRIEPLFISLLDYSKGFGHTEHYQAN